MSLKKQIIERNRDQKLNYGLYCVNIYGSGLRPIKDQFKHQVRTGLRQTVFIIDLEDIPEEELHNQSRIGQQRQELQNHFNTPLTNIILQHVQKYLREYDFLIKKINEELKFDLYEYWLKSIEDGIQMSKEKPKEKTTKAMKKSSSLKGSLTQGIKKSCSKTVIVKEHNRVGQPESYSKRKYIKDEPTQGKLFIIILGQMSEHFYMDLIRRGQPLEAIINFTPAESNYDIMLGNNKLKKFLFDTCNTINSSIYQMRQEINIKPVGLFHYKLPIISTCLATKYSRDIYDQLTWTVYDIEVLKQQYELYYYRAFQITNVAIPANVDLRQYYHLVETLNMQDPYQQTNLFKSGSDLATIASYLNSLLNTFGLPDTIEESCNENSFSSITKIAKLERIIVDASNQLLVNMLQYTTQNRFQSIYDCCLDYNIFKKYMFYSQKSVLENDCRNNIDGAGIQNDLLPQYVKCYANAEGTAQRLSQKSVLESDGTGIQNILLPEYIKCYANADGTAQRLYQLIEEYDEYQIDEMDETGYKMFTFKKHINVLTENQGVVVIPTRLCFRDFTLFKMTEFLENLKISRENTSEDNKNSKSSMEFKDDTSIFIRLNSLKALKLQKDFSQDDTTRSSRRSTKQEKKSFINSGNRDGLPPDHHLLKGYNLEDTLQEVKFKTSKYHYAHGFVKLYEEKWCFQDTNKQLTFNCNDTTIILNRPRYQLNGVGLSNSIRLITKNDIHIRILNEPKEYYKIIMNYPNGLSIFYHENFCVQNWNCDQSSSSSSHNDEQRRIYTPFGCVIVFHKTKDRTLIMRYNGEVYQLLQYELEEAEEEEQSQSTESLNTFHQHSSAVRMDIKAQGDVSVPNENYNKKHKSNLTNTNNAIGDTSTSFKDNKKSKSKIYTKNHKFSHKISKKELLKNELKYLDTLVAVYELKYLHVTITTTQGRCFNMNSKGKIFESPACCIKEWRDYFANEDYCERSDGVKMIWTKDCFKCYHTDGTLFKTTIEESIVSADMNDFESQISQSSSHGGEEENSEEQPRISDLRQQSFSTLQEHCNYTEFLKNNTAEEEYIAEDTQYVNYTCNSCFMQHRYYASVHMLTSDMYSLLQPIDMQVFGIDNIRLNIQTDNQAFSQNNMEEEFVTEDQEITKVVINVWIDENLHITADEEACKICAVIHHKYNAEKSTQSDSLILKFKYSDCINDAFKYLLKEIASLKECNNESHIQKLYFIEKTNQDASIRGFEFFTSLPLKAVYNYHISNNITELNPIATIDEMMLNNFTQLKEDMQKFPRFKQPYKKTTNNLNDNFPYVLSANIFMKIPKLLRNVENITKFLEPFENMNFKKLRNKFKNVLNFYCKPELQLDLKYFQNANNWKKCHWEHQRRLFLEQQRLGLYYAMNKHNIFPGYWKFKNEYKSHIRHLEFFEFMQNKCESKAKDN